VTESPGTAQALAEAVVATMMANDAFSRWLGISVLEIAPGRSTIRMTVRDEMVNGFGTSHGGIVYSLADSAFAFATNAAGTVSVAVDCTISYPRPVRPGDVLTAVAVEQSNTNRLSFCEVTVRNQDDVTVGHFRGTVYRTSRMFFPPSDGSPSRPNES
jgi:acyl-CoA thioesterase